MSPRREMPTVHWQAIVAPNLVVLQQGDDVVLCDSTAAGPTTRRDNVLSNKFECPPFPLPTFKCARTK